MVSRTICPGWLWTTILLISASWVGLQAWPTRAWPLPKISNYVDFPCSESVPVKHQSTNHNTLSSLCHNHIWFLVDYLLSDSRIHAWLIFKFLENLKAHVGLRCLYLIMDIYKVAISH
jgi:hypothetical protein